MSVMWFGCRNFWVYDSGRVNELIVGVEDYGGIGIEGGGRLCVGFVFVGEISEKGIFISIREIFLL